MGLRVLGLHWLFARTQGLHIHPPESAVRRATRDYLLRLMDLCRALGGDIMVFGSPPARGLLPGQSPTDAFARTRDFFADVIPDAAARGVALCFEPLARQTTTFIRTAAAALALMRAVGHAHFRLNLDTIALSDGRARESLAYLRRIWAKGWGAAGWALRSRGLPPPRVV